MSEEKTMHKGSWECSGCGAPITELPFEPRGTGNLLCKNCHRDRQNGGVAPRKEGGGEKKMFSGNWQCSGCGAPINELPFEPRSTANLKCRECFRSARG